MERLLNAEWPDHDIKANVFGYGKKKKSSYASIGSTNRALHTLDHQSMILEQALPTWIYVLQQCGMVYEMCEYWQSCFENVNLHPLHLIRSFVTH